MPLPGAFATLNEKGLNLTAADHCSWVTQYVIEARSLITLLPNDPLWSDVQAEWSGLMSLARLTCRRQIRGEESTEERFFISSIGHYTRRVLRACGRIGGSRTVWIMSWM
jgi:hypothetical protein